VDTFSQLDTVAQIAAALLGFFAVFIALSKSDGRFSESDRHFIQAIVLSATLAIILSLLPRALSLHFSEQFVWTVSAIAAIVLGGLAMLLVAWRQFHMSKEEAALVHWGWHLGAWSLGFVAAVCFVLAVVHETETYAYYVSGVSALIPLGLFTFIGVVFRRFL